MGGGGNFTSSLRFCGPFFMQQNELFLPYNLHPVKGTPEAPLDKAHPFVNFSSQASLGAHVRHFEHAQEVHTFRKASVA